MAARLRAPRLLLMLALLTAASTLAIAPAAGAQEESGSTESTVCLDEDVDTDLFSDGAWEIRVANSEDPEGTIYDLRDFDSLSLPRGRWIWVSMVSELEGRTFTRWSSSEAVWFHTPRSSGSWVWIEGIKDILNGGCDAWIAADYSDPPA
jgi:hypothetical protein